MSKLYMTVYKQSNEHHAILHDRPHVDLEAGRMLVFTVSSNARSATSYLDLIDQMKREQRERGIEEIHKPKWRRE